MLEHFVTPGLVVWGTKCSGHVVVLGPRVHDVLPAQAAVIHDIDNCMILGKSCRGRQWLQRLLVLNGASRSSG